MRKEYGLYLLLSLLFIWMIYADISSLKGHRYWFWDVSFFSNWENKPCDYATNAVVHNFYNKPDAYWWREPKYKEFANLGSLLPKEFVLRLANSESLVVGLDKYALMNLSNRMTPNSILGRHADELMNDGVVRYKVYIADNKLNWSYLEED